MCPFLRERERARGGGGEGTEGERERAGAVHLHVSLPGAAAAAGGRARYCKPVRLPPSEPVCLYIYMVAQPGSVVSGRATRKWSVVGPRTERSLGAVRGRANRKWLVFGCRMCEWPGSVFRVPGWPVRTSAARLRVENVTHNCKITHNTQLPKKNSKACRNPYRFAGQARRYAQRAMGRWGEGEKGDSLEMVSIELSVKSTQGWG